jgi:hypothetical protein
MGFGTSCVRTAATSARRTLKYLSLGFEGAVRAAVMGSREASRAASFLRSSAPSSSAAAAVSRALGGWREGGKEEAEEEEAPSGRSSAPSESFGRAARRALEGAAGAGIARPRARSRADAVPPPAIPAIWRAWTSAASRDEREKEASGPEPLESRPQKYEEGAGEARGGTGAGIAGV